MNLIRQSYQIWSQFDYSLAHEIEDAARVCYKSEDKVTEGSAEKLVKSLITSGHHAMLEHAGFTVKFITDRGVTHELVRHRIAAYAQESTRYCNYSKDKFGNSCTFIIPSWCWNIYEGKQQSFTRTFASGKKLFEMQWAESMQLAENIYLSMLEHGATPQEARTVLPNSLKTEIVMTANVREWRHVLTLRTAKNAHPQMRDLMLPLLKELQSKLPILFDDIGEFDISE